MRERCHRRTAERARLVFFCPGSLRVRKGWNGGPGRWSGRKGWRVDDRGDSSDTITNVPAPSPRAAWGCLLETQNAGWGREVICAEGRVSFLLS